MGDPFVREAFLIESLNLYSSFVEPANHVIFKGAVNALDTALEAGHGIVTESTGAGLGGVKPMMEKARKYGYKIIGARVVTPIDLCHEFIEKRYDLELQTGEMLGGRRFDAFIDRFLAMGDETWPLLTELCDEVIERRRPPAGTPTA